MVDNQPAIACATLGRIHDRSKHISLKYRFVQDLVEKSMIRLEYIPTTQMRADILTKALPAPRHEVLATEISGGTSSSDQAGV